MADRGLRRKSGKKEDIVRCFEVTDPTIHPKGHTIYKITQKLIPIDNPEKNVEELIPIDNPEKNVEEIVVWRRYNDIKKLYSAMLKLHKALHRKEEFPPFAKAKVFGRYEKDVIVERQRCAQDLLNFVAQRHYFVISKAFQQFFQDGERSQVSDNATGLLQPDRLFELTKEDESASTCTQDSDIESISSDFTALPEDITELSLNRPIAANDMPSNLEAGDTDEILGGVWKYRQIADKISLGEMDDDENTDFTDDSTLSTPLPSAEVAFFDPFYAGGETEQSSNARGQQEQSSNEWLLAAMETCGVSLEKGGTPASSGTPDGSVSLEPTTQSQLTGMVPLKITDTTKKPTFFFENSSEDEKTEQGKLNNVPKSASCDNFSLNNTNKSKYGVQHGKGDLNFSLSTSGEPLGNVVTNSRSTTSVLDSNTSPSPSKKTTLSVPGKSSGTDLPRNVSLLNLDMKDKGDYIFQAASQISLGLQCEANNNYNMAFNYFRTGVGILLTGVQLDENSARREVVRRKTAKYLVKAEKLHKKYLETNGDNSISDRWDPGKISPTKVLEPQAACLQGSLSELCNYKVIGIVDKVMLVMDSVTDKCYIMKTVQKSCVPNSKKRNIVPTNCPYMACLHRFYDTNTAIILLMDHIPGGKLWTYISSYLHNTTSQNDVGDIINDEHERELRYAGKPQNKLDDSHATNYNSNSNNQSHVDNLDIKQLNGIGLKSDSDGNENVLINRNTNVVSFKAPLTNETAPVSQYIKSDIKENLNHSQTKEFDHKSTYLIENERNNVDTDIYDIEDYNNVKPPLLMGQTQSQFQDLLESATKKPTMENFSVNSFESDSGHGSRFESVVDHIESIQEVSETSSPLTSPKKIKDNSSTSFASLAEDKMTIIVDNIPAECLSNRTQNQNCNIHDTRPNNSNKQFNETDHAFSTVINTDSVFSEGLSDKLTCEDSPVTSFLQSTPKCKGKDSLYRTTDSNEGTSIYDYNRSPISPNSSVSLQSESGKNCEVDEDVKYLVRDNTEDKDTITEINDAVQDDNAEIIEPIKNVVFKQLSQERSLETGVKTRHRTPSGMSSVFGDLEMSGEESRISPRLPENCVRQWAAEIVVALEHLHHFGLACRDLNPDNLLLGDRGHITLTYFSQWSLVEYDIKESVVANFYSAPEVISLGGDQSTACDWWSLGALLFELFTGKKLSQYYPSGINSHTQLEIPGEVSSEAQALLKDLLKFSTEERLGSARGGVEDIKLHPFFHGVDWKTLASQC